MRHWKYLELPDKEGDPAVEIIKTDEEILDEYWNYWCSQMIRVRKSPMMTEENCIEDYVVVNWAWEI